MRAHLLGVRGSTPSPGPATVRYGGNTSCVAVARDGEAPTLVLDAGTGLRGLGALLPDGAPFRGAIVLSHLHWDHVQGLPFSPAVDRADAEVDLYLPVRAGDDPDEVLRRAMSPPHFPIGPDGLRGRWRLHALPEGEHDLGGLDVTVADVPHKGGRTVGVRVSDGAGSLAYVPDHGPLALGPGARGDGTVHDTVLRLADRVDVLLHDAQHTAEEFPSRAHFGHTTIDYAMEVGRAARAGRTVLFHHDPNRSDDALDAIAASLPDTVSVAVEGDVLSASPTVVPTPTPPAAPAPTPAPGAPRTA